MKRLLLLGLFAMQSAVQSATVDLRIDTTHPGPVVHKDVYGQFAEHLGTGVYGGLWVGTDSPIPNTRGWRNDAVAALKALNVPLVRWPGGCFADEYHWRDGIGPAAQRPKRLNKLWGGVLEPNQVGTHEFFDLVEQLGADAYVNGNLGSGSVQEMADWLEYLTSDSASTLADERRKNGRQAPFKLTHFAVGNEAWGCGGHMTPETYAAQYRQTATFLRSPNRPKLIAAGGNDADTRWTEVLSREITHTVDAIAHHYYTFPSGQFNGKGRSRGFGEAEWISTLANAHKLGGFIDKNLAVLDKNDPNKKLAFYVDEWGTWYDDDPELKHRGLLAQHNTLRDALVAALHFNLFHERAERVRMANIAQMTNVLQAMLHTEGERMVLTPTYHAFALYRPFQGATSLPVTLSPVPELPSGDYRLPAISVSAARATDGRLVLAIVNSAPHTAHSLRLQLPAGAPKSASGLQITGPALDAHNTFDQPDTVRPQAVQYRAKEGVLSIALPAASVQVLTLEP
ncbi:alpha-N-arabinofuranosidase [Ideonella sp.]|uniref:alpha-N-arabinofuranosidase n=1 Tax=Ideonella sp. TaxID=1929293 RepID=UPI003BB801E5